MDDSATECFDYIISLSKQLSEIQEERRRETEKIEQLLKKIARQSFIDYNDFSMKPLNYSDSSEKTPSDRLTQEEALINENFQLLYQIKKQEYIKKKSIELIEQYKELITSIKYLIIEQDALKPRIEKEFIADKILPQSKQLRERINITNLESSNIQKNKNHFKSVLVKMIENLRKLDIKEVNEYIDTQGLLTL